MLDARLNIIPTAQPHNTYPSVCFCAFIVCVSSYMWKIKLEDN